MAVASENATSSGVPFVATCHVFPVKSSNVLIYALFPVKSDALATIGTPLISTVPDSGAMFPYADRLLTAYTF